MTEKSTLAGIRRKKTGEVVKVARRGIKADVAPKMVHEVKTERTKKTGTGWMVISYKSNTEQIREIRRGFSAKLLKNMGEFFEVPEARILKVVRLPKTTAHRLIQNDKRMTQDNSERLYRIAIVTRQAIEVFGNENGAREWMVKPNLAFGNEAPLELIDTEPGAEIVKKALNAIATGGAL